MKKVFPSRKALLMLCVDYDLSFKIKCNKTDYGAVLFPIYVFNSWWYKSTNITNDDINLMTYIESTVVNKEKSLSKFWTRNHKGFLIEIYELCITNSLTLHVDNEKRMVSIYNEFDSLISSHPMDNMEFLSMDLTEYLHHLKS